MLVYHDPDKRNTLTRYNKGPRRNQYMMIIAGWYAGAFSAQSDTEALNTFKRIIREEGAA